MVTRILTVTCAIVLVVGTIGTASAQLPHTQLNSIYPPGGKAGGELQVKITGKDLEEATQLKFSHDGIAAQARTGEVNDVEPNPKPIANEFIVKIADNVPAGVYEVSAVGRYGISNTRAFVVSKCDAIVASGDHSSRDKALELPIDSTAFGTINADQVNHYKFQAKKDQRILIDCCAERIDSSIDATLVLFGPDGRKIRIVRDTQSCDPVLDFAAPADGEYVVGVYDFVFRGGSNYFYHLAISSSPWIDFVIPPAGQPGSSAQYTIYGRNLPGGSPAEGLSVEGAPLQQLKVSIALPSDPAQISTGHLASPNSAFVDGHVYRLDSPQGPSNPVTIGFAQGQVVQEKEPNNDGNSAAIVTLPCEYAGQFYPGGDIDWVAFEAKKGETIWINLLSHRLGATTDPVLVVQKVKKDGDNVQVSQVTEIDDSKAPAQNDKFQPFDTGSRDASFKLDVAEDATYRVMVRDLYGTSRGDPRYVYRLQISKSQPDFRLAAYPQPLKAGDKGMRPAGTVLRRAGAAVVNVRIDRRHAYSGDISISAEGLPAGVTCNGITASGGTSSVALVFCAEENAAAWAGFIRIVGKANVNGTDVSRTAVGGTIIWESQNAQQQPIGGRTSQGIPLSVTDKESSPVTITIGDGNVVETSVGGKVDLPIKLARRGFGGDLKLTPQSVPKDFGIKETTVKGDAGKLEVALANNKIVPGTHTFYLRGQAKFKYARNPNAPKEAQDEQKRLGEVVKQFETKNKEATDALNKAKQDKQPEDAIKQLEEAAKKAADNLKRAQDLKKAADGAIKGAQEMAKQKDVTTDVFSKAVQIRVAATPINTTLGSANATIKQGEKAQIKVTVERKFGFDDQVEVSITGPAGVGGKVAIAKGQNEGMLEIATGGDTPVGDHECQVNLQVKFNSVTIQSTENIKLTVNPA
jgi:hypothetical protein